MIIFRHLTGLVAIPWHAVQAISFSLKRSVDAPLPNGNPLRIKDVWVLKVNGQDVAYYPDAEGAQTEFYNVIEAYSRGQIYTLASGMTVEELALFVQSRQSSSDNTTTDMQGGTAS